MIDSSGRRFLRADGTVFDLLPVGHVAGVTGALLVALFTLVRPEASAGLGTAARIAFWTLHVGLGLGALLVASRWLANGSRLPGNAPGAVILTGLAAIALAAPGYLALDGLFAPHVVDADPDPATPRWAVRLVEEALELAPPFMASWLLVNLPVLLPRPELEPRLDDAVERGGLGSEDDAGTAPAPPLRAVGGGRAPDAAPAAPQERGGQRFLATLPGVVGTDVVAVASDLHYLNVWTVAGRTTVLGNLRDVVDELGEVGMQVHRSHWVAHRHVRRIVGTAGDAACLLSNELRVPVSRRRWKAVREQYGRGVVQGVAAPRADASPGR